MALAVVVLGACGEGFTRAAAVDSFAEANPEATPDQASCVVDGLIDRYGLDELATELDTSPLDAAFEEDQFREMFVCGLEGDVRDQIATQLTNSGVSEEDAPCVADDLVSRLTDADIDVLLSGEITDAFSEKFYTALDACDAL